MYRYIYTQIYIFYEDTFLPPFSYFIHIFFFFFFLDERKKERLNLKEERHDQYPVVFFSRDRVQQRVEATFYVPHLQLHRKSNVIESMLATFLVRVAPVKDHGAEVVNRGQTSALDVRSCRVAPHRVQYNWKQYTTATCYKMLE